MNRFNTEAGRIGLVILSLGIVGFLVSTGATQPDAAASTGSAMEHQVTFGELLTFLGFCVTASAVVWKGGKLEARLEAVEGALRQLREFETDISQEKVQSISDRSRLASEISTLCERIDRVEKWQDRMQDSNRKGGPTP